MTHAGRYNWNDSIVVNIAGQSPTEFLQGYLTLDTQRLSNALLLPTAICNVQGRVVANGWCCLTDQGSVNFVTHRSLGQRVVDFLKPYAMFSRCQLTLDSQSAQLSDSETPNFMQWNLTVADHEPGLIDLSNTILSELINSEHAWISHLVSEKFLPQMLGLEAVGAIDFDKGCYLGQEVVARAQFRGAVKRRLSSFAWQTQIPAVNSKTADGKTVICATNSPGTSAQGVGLAVG